MPVIEFLYLDGGPNALCWFLRSILVSMALPLDPVLELAAKDATIQNCLHLIVLLIIHNYWQWWGIHLLG